MKPGALPIRRQTAQGYLIPLTHKIIHIDQILLIEAIYAEEAVRMFKDNQVAIAGNGVATIDDFAGGSSMNIGAFGNAYFDPLVGFQRRTGTQRIR